jgi:hypothetical protein
MGSKELGMLTLGAPVPIMDSILPSGAGAIRVDSNPKKAFGAVKPCPSFVPPIALIELSRVMQLGGAKYGAYNWQDTKVDATTYYDAAMRHLMEWYTLPSGQGYTQTDPESGAHILAHVMACCAILIDGQMSGHWIDNRPKTTPVHTRIRELAEKPLNIPAKMTGNPYLDLPSVRRFTAESNQKRSGGYKGYADRHNDH